MQKLVSRLLPFLFAGIAIVAFTFSLMLLGYLFIFGALVGFVLFSLAWIKNTFFPSKPSNQPQTEKQSSGRIIDVQDWKKM